MLQERRSRKGAGAGACLCRAGSDICDSAYLWPCCLCAFVCSAVALVLHARDVAAHELGLTRVTVTFTADGQVQRRRARRSRVAAREARDSRRPVAVGRRRRSRSCRPASPRSSRSCSSGRACSSTARAVTLDLRLHSRCPAGNSAAARPGVGPAERAAPTAVVRLVGDVPRGARTFQVNYGLVLGLVRADARRVRRAAGRAPSGSPAARTARPSTCAPASSSRRRSRPTREYLVLGFEHILPKGLDHILFVLGLFLLSAAVAAAAAAGDDVHGRAFDDAGLVDVRRRRAALDDRRAADRAVDHLRRDREPLHQRAEAVAGRAGLRVRPAARPGLRRRARRARAAARRSSFPRWSPSTSGSRPASSPSSRWHSPPSAGGGAPKPPATAAGSSSPPASPSPSSAPTGPSSGSTVEPSASRSVAAEHPLISEILRGSVGFSDGAVRPSSGVPAQIGGGGRWTARTNQSTSRCSRR